MPEFTLSISKTIFAFQFPTIRRRPCRIIRLTEERTIDTDVVDRVSASVMKSAVNVTSPSADLCLGSALGPLNGLARNAIAENRIVRTKYPGEEGGLNIALWPGRIPEGYSSIV